MAIAFARTPELTSRRADFTLMIIPASTNERHELRFRNFSVEFTGLLRIANGYDAITVTRDREEYKGQHYKNKTDNLHFDEAAIRGRHILLFDDLLTTGAGLSQVSRKLLACGALSVTCLPKTNMIFCPWRKPLPQNKREGPVTRIHAATGLPFPYLFST